MKDEIAAKIEKVELLAKSGSSDYRPIFFKRVKYKSSPECHLQIRQFQRGYNDSGEEEYYATKNGFQMLEKDFMKVVEKLVLVPKKFIHPLILEKCQKLLDEGNYEQAVFKAFKTIEIVIRNKIGASESEYGVKLIRRAFNINSGPLSDYSLPVAEREGISNYIAGSYAYYKNPGSHRDIDLDYISAFERIVVASDILKIVDNANLTEAKE